MRVFFTKFDTIPMIGIDRKPDPPYTSNQVFDTTLHISDVLTHYECVQDCLVTLGASCAATADDVIVLVPNLKSPNLCSTFMSEFSSDLWIESLSEQTRQQIFVESLVTSRTSSLLPTTYSPIKLYSSYEVLKLLGPPPHSQSHNTLSASLIAA